VYQPPADRGGSTIVCDQAGHSPCILFDISIAPQVRGLAGSKRCRLGQETREDPVRVSETHGKEVLVITWLGFWLGLQPPGAELSLMGRMVR